MLPIAFCTLLLNPADTVPVVQWSFAASEVVEGRFTLELTANVADGWHIYATKLENDMGPIPTTIRFSPSEHSIAAGQLEEPAPEEVFDPNFEMQVRYHSGTPRFVQAMNATTMAPFQLSGEVEYMVCNDKTCLPPEVVRFTMDIQQPDKKH